jgi:hypothetical protein
MVEVELFEILDIDTALIISRNLKIQKSKNYQTIVYKCLFVRVRLSLKTGICAMQHFGFLHQNVAFLLGLDLKAQQQ